MSSKTKKATPWQNRIVGHGSCHPEDLMANPLNFRTHPKEQQDALEAVLDTVGWIQDVVVNVRTQTMVDGHLRVLMAMRRNEDQVPVKYVDLTDNEEALVLATLDQIGALATQDKDQLERLLREVQTGHPILQQLLDDMATAAGIVPAHEGDGDGEGGDGDGDGKLHNIIVLCENRERQREVLDWLQGEGVPCRPE